LNYLTDKFTLSNREYSAEGYLFVKNSKLARVGVMTYAAGEIPFMQGAPSTLKDTDIVRVYRGPEELFKKEVLESFQSQPITFEHPSTLVDAKVAKKALVGFSVGEVSTQGDFMVADLKITDDQSIQQVEKGVKELSLGYTADIIWQPGVTKTGEQYDAIQRNIKGNHIAIVPAGRCGSDCKISDNQNKNIGDKKMDHIVLDHITYECPEQTAQAFRKLLQKKDAEFKSVFDSSEEAKKKLMDEMEEYKKKLDDTQAKLDEMKKNEVSDAQLNNLVAERISLLKDAKTIVGEDFNGESLSSNDLKKKVVKDACPDLDIESKSLDYINARFDALLETAQKSKLNQSAIIDTMTYHASDSVTDSINATMSLSERIRLERINKNKQTRSA
jgi:hypothetical protein